MTMHADELPISAAVVRDLVGAQFPDWGRLPVSRVDSPGTVNAIFRTGDKLAALSQVGLEMFKRLVYRDLQRPDIVGGVGK